MSFMCLSIIWELHVSAIATLEILVCSNEWMNNEIVLPSKKACETLGHQN